MFHVCEEGGKKNSFLCPVGTIFNQQHFVCDWWSNVDCNAAQGYYALNNELYKEPPRREEPRPQPRPVQNTGVLTQGRTTQRYVPEPVTRPCEWGIAWQAGCGNVRDGLSRQETRLDRSLATVQTDLRRDR